MSKMKVQDATKELSRRAGLLLKDVSGVRTAAEKTLNELRKIESSFLKQEEAVREEKRREEEQKAIKTQSVAWTMPDDVPAVEEKKEAIDLAIKALSKAKGHWKDVPVERDIVYSTGIRYTCSVCGQGNCYGHPPYCMYCGAELKKEGEE